MNVPPFIQAPENRRQKSTSYFPYIMYNTKKIRTYRDVQYGKNAASGCTIRKNNVRSHVLNGCFWLDENYSCIINNGIHLLKVIFTGWRHNPYSICNKTITDFCISEYELLLTCKSNIDLSLRLRSISFYRSIKTHIHFYKSL